MDKSCTIQDVFERFYPSYEKRSTDARILELLKFKDILICRIIK